MSESEIQRIWQAINNLAQKVERLSANIEIQAEMISELRADVKNMAANGCSKSVQHADHESRLRSLETSRNLAVGGAGVIGSIFGTIGGWLMTRIGGH